MMDELAHLAGLDPYEFRKRNISHPRWLGVLKAATDAAKWTPRVAASNVSSARIAACRGVGLGTYHVPMNRGDRITFAAAVVEIEVNKDTGAYPVLRFGEHPAVTRLLWSNKLMRNRRARARKFCPP